ncbi:hypothetical protein [Lentzea sp. CA-135723]|uniref:hypothetical protein n=1 Tax=Lentzea sp. CA-135723 TaxID=3239950 RepID=UPI003D8CB5F3
MWLAAGMAVLLIVAIALAGRPSRQQATASGQSSSAVTTTTTTRMWMDIRDGSRTRTLTISATGAWTLTVGDIDMAKVANAPLSGNGDTVPFDGPALVQVSSSGAWTITPS